MIPVLPAGPKVTPVVASTASRPLLRVVDNDQLTQASKAADEQRVAAEDAAVAVPDYTELAGFIRNQYDKFRNHRNQVQSGWSDRLLNALRVFNGQYDSTQLNEIEKFGGSKVYARVIAMKCRGASSLLRDVYLAPDRPWGLDPPDDPSIPDNILQSIGTLVASEVSGLAAATQAAGVPPPDPGVMRDRVAQLTEAARQAAKKKASSRRLSLRTRSMNIWTMVDSIEPLLSSLLIFLFFLLLVSKVLWLGLYLLLRGRTV
jgi:hypothetical protein